MELATTASSAAAWAAARFRDFEASDPRRGARVVAMATRLATHPAGRVTRAFPAGDAQQAAYDWLAHPDDDARALMRCEAAAAIGACRDDAVAWVAVDMMDLQVVDHAAVKGTGRLATDRRPRRGLLVTTALVDRGAAPLAGVAAQAYHARPEQPAGDSHARPLAEKETRYWGLVIATTAARFAAHAPGCTPWFLCDRGADFVEFIVDNLRAARLWTVRAKYDRKVVDRAHDRLRALVAAQPVLGYATLDRDDSADVPRRRDATLALRACPVVLQVATRLERRAWAAACWAVSVTEVDPPFGAAPLSWLLLTSYPVDDFADAVRVVQGYARRPRIEEYHRVWKTGGCDVEAQQLRSRRTIEKWSRLLSSVAVRLIQVRDAARDRPSAPATEYFTPAEIAAVVLLRRPRDHAPATPPTLGRVVRWIAELGGYTGRSSGGPPGITVLRRGWDRVETACEVLAKLKAPP